MYSCSMSSKKRNAPNVPFVEGTPSQPRSRPCWFFTWLVWVWVWVYYRFVNFSLRTSYIHTYQTPGTAHQALLLPGKGTRQSFAELLKSTFMNLYLACIFFAVDIVHVFCLKTLLLLFSNHHSLLYLIFSTSTRIEAWLENARWNSTSKSWKKRWRNPPEMEPTGCLYHKNTKFVGFHQLKLVPKIPGPKRTKGIKSSFLNKPR